MQFKETSEQMKQTGRSGNHRAPLAACHFGAGEYSLEVNAPTRFRIKPISRSAEFTVKAPVETKTAVNAAPGR